MSFSSILNSLKDANQQTAKVNQALTNANPSQTPGKLNQLNSQIIGITKNVTGIVSNASNVAHSVSKFSKVFSNGKDNAFSKLLEGSDEVLLNPTDDKLKEDETNGEPTGLKGFYSKFSGNGLYASDGTNHIDRENTFECWFDFEPTNIDGEGGTFLQELISTTRLNLDDYEIYGRDSMGGVSYTGGYTGVDEGNTTFLDLGIYIQKFTVPNIITNGNGTAQSLIGEFPLNGSYLTTDSHTLILDVLNTRNPIHESIFYPWMREVQMNKWQYQSQPYTTANITIDLTEHTDVQYVFLNCRPSQIMSLQPSQEPNNTFSRQITFIFDYMMVKHDGRYNSGQDPMYDTRTTESLTTKADSSWNLEKIGKVIGSGMFAASNTLKI